MAKSDAMLRQRIEEIMLAKGITKAKFASKIGCLPQNVNALLETKNLDKLVKIAEVIECDVTDFMTPKAPQPQPVINGYIEYEGEVFAIKSMADFNKLHDKIKKRRG